MTEQEQLRNMIDRFDSMQIEIDAIQSDKFESLTILQKEIIIEHLFEARSAVVHAKSVIRGVLYNIE